jgi:hypothetical protein
VSAPREKGETAFEDHKAHLGHGGPGERGLHGRLRQHHQAAEQGGKTADHDEQRENSRRKQHHVGESD